MDSKTAQEVPEICVEAYVYFYPLVMMDLTRRVTTNLEPGKKPGLGPMNMFNHFRAYPTAESREAVRFNFDTVYSMAWLDLTNEPIIVSAPDTQDRYYLLPMLDMWTDVFAVPGKRTSGTNAANYAVVPPGWKGAVPPGAERIDSPTAHVLIIGRTQTNGPKDYAAVHKVQDGYTLTPLSQWCKTLQPIKAVIDPSVDMKTPPLDQVNKMPAAAYFKYAAELMKLNSAPYHRLVYGCPAQANRYRTAKKFDYERVAPNVQQALDEAVTDALKGMYAKYPTLARVVTEANTYLRPAMAVD